MFKNMLMNTFNKYANNINSNNIIPFVILYLIKTNFNLHYKMIFAFNKIENKHCVRRFIKKVKNM